MIRYVVTTHSGSPLAYLSRDGNWGNLPFPTVEAGQEYAKADADQPYSIIVKRAKPRN